MALRNQVKQWLSPKARLPSTLEDWTVATHEKWSLTTDWALIRRLAGEDVPKAQIAARLGISRTTVVEAVASRGPPSYERWQALTASRRPSRWRGRRSSTSRTCRPR
jgi:hypothetical protein